MVGAFFGYYTGMWISKTEILPMPGYPAFFLALICAMLGCAILGFLIERFAYRPLRDAPKLNALITAIGVSLFLEYAGQLVFGAEPKVFPNILEDSEVFSSASGDVRITRFDYVILAVSLGLLMILNYIIFQTKLGKAMRATSYNASWASLMGIPVDRVISMTFVIGSALAAAGGILVGVKYPKIEPLMGVMIGLKAFVAAVLGGIGNLTGAVLGGMIMGLSEQFVVGYLSSTYRDALAFIILIVILLLKPAGLLGKFGVEKV
jgi:branched-chain amino acid transport system permease protein